MALIRIDHNPSARNLLWFGGMLGLFLAIVGAMAWWRFHAPGVAQGFWIAAAVLVVAYYAIPPLRKPLYLGWMYAAFPIGFVMSYVILAATYYLVITPIGLALRLCGHDPLDRRLDRSAKSYWRPHSPAADSRRYFRQF